MPCYLFSNPSNPNEIKEIYQSMTEKHVYSENGVEWIREYTIPQASIDGKINCWSSQSFVEKTGKMKGTVGDLWKYSSELSQKRASENGGQDPLAAKARENYSKERNGKPLVDFKKLANAEVTVDLQSKKIDIK